MHGFWSVTCPTMDPESFLLQDVLCVAHCSLTYFCSSSVLPKNDNISKAVGSSRNRGFAVNSLRLPFQLCKVKSEQMLE